MSRPAIGDMRETISLRHPVRTEDGRGGHTVNYEEYAEVAAKVRSTSSGDRVFAERVQAEITHVITIRWRDDVRAEDVVVWRGITMVVTGPPREEDVMRRFLRLECTEGMATAHGGAS